MTDTDRKAPRQDRRRDRRDERRAGAEQREKERPLRARIRELEKQMETLTAELQLVESRLADPDVYHRLPAEELDDLLARSGKLRKRISDAEEAWLEASEDLELLATG
jgi:ATP-binding cassette subfamily F protein 3